MDNDIKKIINKLKEPILSTKEKYFLRLSLLQKIGRSGVKTERPEPVFSSFSFWVSLTRGPSFRVALASFLIIIMSGGTIVFAAEKSLPGEILYPIKTNINENVVRIISTNSQLSKAQFEAQILEKRLIEAEKLETKELLKEPLKEKIREEISKQETRVENSRDKFIKDNKEISEKEKEIKNDNTVKNNKASDTDESKNVILKVENTVKNDFSNEKGKIDMYDKNEEDRDGKDEIKRIREKYQGIIKKLEIEEKEGRQDKENKEKNRDR